MDPKKRLALSTQPTIYGCCGLFDLCGDADLMALSFQGVEPFLDWIGWEGTNECRIKKNFITWVRPEYSDGSATAGYVADPCADGSGTEFGTCDFTLEDFGRLRRHTPTRDVTKVGLKLCEAQPRYRLDGQPITDDFEYDLRIVTEVIMQDLKRYLVTGNASTSGLFSGLQTLVNTGYTDAAGHLCSMMDSIVIDWNGNTTAGGAGITWNGAAIAATYDLVAVLLAVLRRIRDRIQWSPTLSAQQLKVGDIVIVGNSNFLRCLLDAYTCWSVCPGAQYNEANLNTFEARTFRQNLNGGMFGAGKIFLDGLEIPLIAYGWGLQKGPTLSDFYVLTGHVGNVRVISGQYNDMRDSVDSPNYDATDGGRLLTWKVIDHTCEQRYVEMQPRLLMWAPWAQARFTDVKCVQPGGVLLPDPTETSFYPESSFNAPACP